MKRFINWLKSRISPRKASQGTALDRHLRQTGAHKAPRPSPRHQAVPDRQPDFVNLDSPIKGRIENNGPDKNVRIRNKYIREDTGTHETLKILDDSIIDSHEEEGIDPYNTGQFDRSKNWDKRTK